MSSHQSQRVARLCILLAVVGMALSGYLTYLHLGLMRGELLGGQVCGGSGALNCHAVTASPWGSFMGIPLSIIGVWVYSIVLGLALYAFQEESAPGEAAMRLIGFLSLAMVGVDLWLFYLMAVVIRYFCVFCLLTYAINLLLLLLSTSSFGVTMPAALSKLPSDWVLLLPSARRPASYLLFGFLLVSFAGTAGVYAATTYMAKGTLKSQLPQIREYLANQPKVDVKTDGDPRKGKPGARIQLVEFSDFLCPVCQRASKLNAVILASHRQDVEFIFKNYPLDMSCNTNMQRTLHEGACQVAAAGECVHKQGKFWEFHDLVFAEKPPYSTARIEQDVAGLGLDMTKFRACTSSGEGMEAVKRDIEQGAAAGVTSTPTFTVNRVLIRGLLSPAMFEDFVQALDDSK